MGGRGKEFRKGKTGIITNNLFNFVNFIIEQ